MLYTLQTALGRNTVVQNKQPCARWDEGKEKSADPFRPPSPPPLTPNKHTNTDAFILSIKQRPTASRRPQFPLSRVRTAIVAIKAASVLFWGYLSSLISVCRLIRKSIWLCLPLILASRADCRAAVNGNLDLVTVAEDEDKTKEIALITVWISRLLRLSPPIRSV